MLHTHSFCLLAILKIAAEDEYVLNIHGICAEDLDVILSLEIIFIPKYGIFSTLKRFHMD